MCTNDDLLERINIADKKFDSGFRHLGERLDDNGKQLGKASTDAHDASVSSAETKTIVESLVTFLERDHKENREDKKDMWVEIDKLKASKNKMYGIVTGISIAVSSAIATIKWLLK